MKTYSIRDWAKHFENNRSRSVERLLWVPVPNRHDGENFRLIISQKNGAEIYGCWLLIIQVASKCQPRGTLLKGNGEPHTALSLALKTGAKVEWFKSALDFLESNTDWLDVQEVAGGCQPTGSRLAADWQPGVTEEKGSEVNGSEVNGTESIASASPPRARNELLDALVAIDGADPKEVTKPAWSAAASALKDIKSVCPLLTTDEIQRRARNYRANMPGAKITPKALAKHWADLDKEINHDSNHAGPRGQRASQPHRNDTISGSAEWLRDWAKQPDCSPGECPHPLD